MTQAIRHILVAVKDVRGKNSPTIRKAATLARALGARLELFHAITDPLAIEALTMAGVSIQKFENDERHRYAKRLERLAEPLRRHGLKVSTSAEWDFPAHEAVIRRAGRAKADLIVAERHATRHVAPWLMRYSDWELLRQSPVPVLLVKTRKPYDSPNILAAIDPSHAFAKTSQLDDSILRLGSRISSALRGRFHVMHTYVPTLMGVAPTELNAPDATARILSHAGKIAKAGFDKALRTARLGRLAPSRRHLLTQHAVDAIPQLAGKLGCHIIVMGALSRSGLKRAVIGNTAERVLDDLPCDLLIAKPRGFSTRVAPRSRGPLLVSLGLPAGVI
jgi:universal stress protein E